MPSVCSVIGLVYFHFPSLHQVLLVVPHPLPLPQHPPDDLLVNCTPPPLAAASQSHSILYRQEGEQALHHVTGGQEVAERWTHLAGVQQTGQVDPGSWEESRSALHA